MKQMKKKCVYLSLIVFCLNSQFVFASGAKRPELEDSVTGTLPSTDSPQNPGDETSSTPPVTPTSPTTPTSPPTPTLPNSDGAYVDHIADIAGSSACASYSWKNRGRAPLGYIKGMALSYARSLCRLKSTTSLGTLLSAAKGTTAKDALAYYSSQFSSLGIANTTAGQTPLKSLFTLGIGLGMRESSGKYCEGWDRSASANRTSAEAEAGLFQSSYDSIGVNSELSKLYAEYKANPQSCFLNEYKQGVTCTSTNMAILGTGAGATFQSFLKSCPGFAAEYAMTTLRVLRAHYGPINRYEAEVNLSCNQMLTKIQEFINDDPNACQDLI